MTRSTAQRKLSPQPPAEPQPQRSVSPRKRIRNMAGEQNNASDAEGVEKPVREQLKKANINAHEAAPATKDTSMITATAAEADEASDDRGERGRQPRKKRSFEEDEDDFPTSVAAADSKLHRRKRSRDSTVEEEELNTGQRKVSGERSRDKDGSDGQEQSSANGTAKVGAEDRPDTPELAGVKRTDAADEAIASPKTKRSRLHSSAEEGQESTVIGQAAGENTVPLPKETETVSGTTKIPSTSGFANTSATSGFGALAGSQISSEPPKPFTASGFRVLPNSSSSGFGAIGKSSGGFGAGGGFATGMKSPQGNATGIAQDQPKESSSSSSTFGGALGQKSAFAAGVSGSTGFGSVTSGFGQIGHSTGFGGTLGNSGFGSLTGGGLSSFASGKSAAGFASGSNPVKGFGAPTDVDDDGEDGEDDGAGFKSPLSQEEDKQDERFYYQDLETGEEDEVTEYSCRAKLYNFAPNPDGKKEWRERGLGILRLNVTKGGQASSEDDDEATASKTQARFLMRADGSHRVVLNTPVKKEIKFGAPTGGPPQGGYMYFMGTIDGKAGLELLQLKIRQQFALELYDRVVELQSEM